jgi:outer membrane lipoprotein LolB
MRFTPFAGLALGLTAGFYLAGCSGIPATEIDSDGRNLLYESRLASLNDITRWEINGKDGGSGNFYWLNEGHEHQMSFHGALGRGAWRLEAEEGEAVLELADGETFRAPSINLLVEQQLGWEVPVDSLAWWVRGLAAPGSWQTRELDERGQLEDLDQSGWAITYGRYKDNDGVVMPSKMTARKGSQTVKLVVRDWHLGPDTAENE